MPVPDKCHQQVVHALEKQGWTVSPNPYSLDTPLNYLYVDIEAWRSSEESVIVVEVKCFPDGTSDMTSLYNAIGQYVVYRSLLRKRKKNRRIYLAVPSGVYQGLFQQLELDIVNELDIDMIVVDMEHEEVEQWIEQ
jgi:hypothetical protein